MCSCSRLVCPIYREVFEKITKLLIRCANNKYNRYVLLYSSYHNHNLPLFLQNMQRIADVKFNKNVFLGSDRFLKSTVLTDLNALEHFLVQVLRSLNGNIGQIVFVCVLSLFWQLLVVLKTLASWF